MYPWKRWHTELTRSGNNLKKLSSFSILPVTHRELLPVYLAFSNMADETSAIPKFMTGTPPQGGLGLQHQG